LDEFESVRVSRLLRASGVIDPAKRQAIIPFPGGKQKLLNVAHTRFPNGGGYSYFRCPKCDTLASVLYLVDDAPRCVRCCATMGIAYRTRMGFGSQRERQHPRDQALNRLVAKLETSKPLRFKPTPASWGGKCRSVYNSRNLTRSMRRRLIELRLNQLASQQASSLAKDGDTLRTYQTKRGHKEAHQHQANLASPLNRQLQQALDTVQVTRYFHNNK
jgi:hypothetical protein